MNPLFLLLKEYLYVENLFFPHTLILERGHEEHTNITTLSFFCSLFLKKTKKPKKLLTTFNGGSLGSCIDEERSELRYVMWIAEPSESSNLWTHIALQSSLCSMSVWVSDPFLWLQLGELWGVGACLLLFAFVLVVAGIVEVLGSSHDLIPLNTWGKVLL